MTNGEPHDGKVAMQIDEAILRKIPRQKTKTPMKTAVAMIRLRKIPHRERRGYRQRRRRVARSSVRRHIGCVSGSKSPYTLSDDRLDAPGNRYAGCTEREGP